MVRVPARAGAIDAAAMARAIGKRTRLAALASVTFAPGFRADLAPIAEACRRRGARLVVDAVQSTGVLRHAVEAEGIDALATSSSKGLLGVIGSGLLYVSARRVGELTPATLSRPAVADASDQSASARTGRRCSPTRGASRSATTTGAGLAALDASLAELRDAGRRRSRRTRSGWRRRCARGWPRPGSRSACRPRATRPPTSSPSGRSNRRPAPSRRRRSRISRRASPLRGSSTRVRRGQLRFGFHLYNDDRRRGARVEAARQAPPTELKREDGIRSRQRFTGRDRRGGARRRRLRPRRVAGAADRSSACSRARSIRISPMRDRSGAEPPPVRSADHAGREPAAYPGLATAWRVVGESLGAPSARGRAVPGRLAFTAQDVEFTARRAGDVPNATAPLSVYTRTIDRIEILEPHRVRVHTKQPAPLLPWDLSTFSIVSKRVGEGATTADYNSGKAAIGTGPYRFAEYVPDDRIVSCATMTGGAAASRGARHLPADRESRGAQRGAARPRRRRDRAGTLPGSRASRGRSGHRRVAHAVVPRDVSAARQLPRVPLNNLRDLEGRPLATNPLRDRRVRLALSRAIARDTLTERVMEGLGVPAGQLVPPALFGHDPTITAPTQDVALARQLLAEAVGERLPDDFA